jgi:pre-mRNA-splicing factor RBM22/SLT11
VFRWKPGPKARFKKTELCGTCARVKNVCQTCIFDLQYGLPVEVRDAYLARAAVAAGGATAAQFQLALTASSAGASTSDANRQFALSAAERSFAEADAGTGAGAGAGGAAGASALLPEAHAALMRIQRTAPHYERNAPKLCSFFANGTCTRGDTCPFRHEMPRDKSDPLAKQNISDRYHGAFACHHASPSGGQGNS